MLNCKVEYYDQYSKKREEGIIVDKFLDYIITDVELSSGKGGTVTTKGNASVDFYKIQKSDKTLVNIPCSNITKIL